MGDCKAIVTDDRGRNQRHEKGQLCGGAVAEENSKVLKSMRKIGYMRVSTGEQRPDRQIDGLKEICDEYFVETLSAVSRRRPIYQKVIRSLRPGDMLVIWDLDRAFRSAKDALNELDLLHKRGVAFMIASLAIDTTTPEGYFVYTIMSGLAEFERRMLSRRTKQGLAAARRRGVRLGRPPKLTQVELFDAHCRIVAGTATPAEIAAEHGMAAWSVTRAINRSLRTPPH
jgi:DNA invertase Pin-like site-specific DNA recombinase